MNTYPVNQVFLGNQSLDSQLQLLKTYEDQLKRMTPEVSIWSKIDAEVNNLTMDQKQKLFSRPEYIEINNQIQNKVQLELLNLVKSKVENDEDGKELLKNLLEVIKKQKKEIIAESNRELDLFNRFKEFSKMNPDATYEDFIKSIM